VRNSSKADVKHLNKTTDTKVMSVFGSSSSCLNPSSIDFLLPDDFPIPISLINPSSIKEITKDKSNHEK
jgi:hypothetical protein